MALPADSKIKELFGEAKKEWSQPVAIAPAIAPV